MEGVGTPRGSPMFHDTMLSVAEDSGVLRGSDLNLVSPSQVQTLKVQMDTHCQLMAQLMYITAKGSDELSSEFLRLLELWTSLVECRDEYMRYRELDAEVRGFQPWPTHCIEQGEQPRYCLLDIPLLRRSNELSKFLKPLEEVATDVKSVLCGTSTTAGSTNMDDPCTAVASPVSANRIIEETIPPVTPIIRTPKLSFPETLGRFLICSLGFVDARYFPDWQSLDLWSRGISIPIQPPLRTAPGRQRVFTLREERLLAIGLERFGFGAFAAVGAYLLPHKDANQIRNRTCNTTAKTPEDSPLIFFRNARETPFTPAEDTVLRHCAIRFSKNSAALFSICMPSRDPCTIMKRLRTLYPQTAVAGAGSGGGVLALGNGGSVGGNGGGSAGGNGSNMSSNANSSATSINACANFMSALPNSGGVSSPYHALSTSPTCTSTATSIGSAPYNNRSMPNGSASPTNPLYHPHTHPHVHASNHAHTHQHGHPHLPHHPSHSSHSYHPYQHHTSMHHVGSPLAQHQMHQKLTLPIGQPQQRYHSTASASPNSSSGAMPMSPSMTTHHPSYHASSHSNNTPYHPAYHPHHPYANSHHPSQHAPHHTVHSQHINASSTPTNAISSGNSHVNNNNNGTGNTSNSASPVGNDNKISSPLSSSSSPLSLPTGVMHGQSSMTRNLVSTPVNSANHGAPTTNGVINNNGGNSNGSDFIPAALPPHMQPELATAQQLLQLRMMEEVLISRLENQMATRQKLPGWMQKTRMLQQTNGNSNTGSNSSNLNGYGSNNINACTTSGSTSSSISSGAMHDAALMNNDWQQQHWNAINDKDNTGCANSNNDLVLSTDWQASSNNNTTVSSGSNMSTSTNGNNVDTPTNHYIDLKRSSSNNSPYESSSKAMKMDGNYRMMLNNTNSNNVGASIGSPMASHLLSNRVEPSNTTTPESHDHSDNLLHNIPNQRSTVSVHGSNSSNTNKTSTSSDAHSCNNMNSKNENLLTYMSPHREPLDCMKNIFHSPIHNHFMHLDEVDNFDIDCLWDKN